MVRKKRVLRQNQQKSNRINKIPRDQTAVIPPSTSNTISPCDVSVYPKILNGANQTTSSLTKVQSINNPAGTAYVPTITDAGASISSGVSVYETEPVESDLDIDLLSTQYSLKRIYSHLWKF